MATAVIDPRIERTHRVVLAATLEVVAERGFSGATIDAISQRCGVARSTIYRHWPERSELLLEAVSVHVGPVETLTTGNLRTDLVAIARHLANLLDSEPIGSVIASLILESRHDPALEQLRQRFITQRQHLASSVLRRAMDAGELPLDVDAGALATDLAAQIFFRALILHAPVDSDWVEGHVDRWLHRYGLEAETKE